MSGPVFPVIENPDELITMTRSDAVNLAISAERGEALAAWIASTALLGHTRPGNTLDYMPTPEPWSAQAFIRDFVAWTSGREQYAPGCADRLREWGTHEAGQRMDRVADKLGLGRTA
jgi:hypothetical protein